MTDFPLVDLLLNIFWFVLAASVAICYFRMFITEKTKARWLMLGIFLAAAGLTISRLHWTPWFWALALGNDPVVLYRNAQKSFNISIFITFAMILQMLGLMLHLHIGMVKYIKGFLTIFVVSVLLTSIIYYGSKEGMFSLSLVKEIGIIQ